MSATVDADFVHNFSYFPSIKYLKACRTDDVHTVSHQSDLNWIEPGEKYSHTNPMWMENRNIST